MFQQEQRGRWGNPYLEPLETVEVTCDSLETTMQASNVGVKQP
jgi:hypothetical protein